MFAVAVGGSRPRRLESAAGCGMRRPDELPRQATPRRLAAEAGARSGPSRVPLARRTQDGQQLDRGLGEAGAPPGIEPCRSRPTRLPPPRPRHYSHELTDRFRRASSCLAAPFERRGRDLLASLGLDAPGWATSETFDDGHALYTAVCRQGLEGVVAKKQADRYRPGERGWVKIKNPTYCRRDSEIEAMQRSRDRRRAVKPAAASAS